MFWSSEEITNHGTNDNKVTVANAITLDHNDAIYILYFIAFAKVIELLFMLYKGISHKVKRRVIQRQNMPL